MSGGAERDRQRGGVAGDGASPARGETAMGLNLALPRGTATFASVPSDGRRQPSAMLRTMKRLDLRNTGIRTWQRASLARRRAIVVVGRPVAAARGVWDDFVEWVNALGLSENTILIAFAV